MRIPDQAIAICNAIFPLRTLSHCKNPLSSLLSRFPDRGTIVALRKYVPELLVLFWARMSCFFQSFLTLLGRPSRHRPRPDPLPNVADFLVSLREISSVAGRGDYVFTAPDGSHLGVVQFVIDSDRQITIHRIWTHQPGRGHGTTMLRALCDLADRHAVEIKLKVLPIGRKPYPLSRQQLLRWYQRHGFSGQRWKLLRAPQCPV
jgi:GNAT superfamily N-acetyltransferase